MSDWFTRPERGAAWLVRLMMWLIRHAGWFASGVVLPGITAWFYAASPSARAASREYLRAALGRPAGALDVLRHIHVFARSTLDRMLMLTGGADACTLDVSGLEHVAALAEAGRGGVLLGAHLGSFAVLRGLAAHCPAPVRMLMHRANGGAMARVIAQLDPTLAADTIPVGEIGTMLRAHEAVASGALVAMLADRAPPGARRVMAPFLGRLAAFPAGPFVLAASLGVPVLTFRAVRVGPRRYQVEFAPFAAAITLRRASREADLAAVAGRYAAWLEEGCRAHPFNWFNFFAFWDDAPGVAARPAGAAGVCPARATRSAIG